VSSFDSCHPFSISNHVIASIKGFIVLPLSFMVVWEESLESTTKILTVSYYYFS
jgi:hypothetical protein